MRQYVPSGEQKLTAAQISDVTAEYQNAYPQFHNDITVPLQSGDPYQVLDALHAFETATERIATSEPPRSPVMASAWWSSQSVSWSGRLFPSR